MSVTDLPALNACLNSISTVLLVFGYIFIKKGDQSTHIKCMAGALISSTLFLISYLTYHANVGHTRFTNPEWFRPWYLALLVTHVILAAAIVPMVLTTVVKALRKRYESHKRWARVTLPLWLYVSVTGVVIYFLLYHIFPQGG
jgi:putative membrane protein